MIPRTLFTGEHELFRDQVRRFIATEITPIRGHSVGCQINNAKGEQIMRSVR